MDAPLAPIPPTGPIAPVSLAARTPSGPGTGIRVPASTYRLQFNASFTFRDALRTVPYLHALGITDVYASPLTAARPGSTHGYDVVDPARLNPDLGTEEDFNALADALAASGMGLLLDIVPNHMAAHHANAWWWDVLERGRDSPRAAFFDIRWEDDPEGKVVLPILGAPLDECIAARELRLRLDPQRGIVLAYHGTLLPVRPEHWPDVLRPIVPDLAACFGAASPAAGALADPAEAGDPADVRSRLAAALAAEPGARVILSAALDAAPPEMVRSVLDRQAYRPEFWRTGLERLNYRRFFDISDLVTVATEREGVFDPSHGLVRSLIARGVVTGLRVDHVDGLADPAGYLRRLRTLGQTADGGVGPVYTIVEKILARHESLPGSSAEDNIDPNAWPVEGTTGYEYLNALSHLLTDPHGVEVIDAHARRTLGIPHSFAETVYQAKRAVMRDLFASEMASLSGQLASLAAGRGVQISADDLAEALAAFTASMRVYRTYITDAGVSAADRAEIEHALQAARRRDGISAAALDLLRDLLLPADPHPPDALAFITRWQQQTGGITAKGVEDTAFYRYTTLASLNEVGGDPKPPPDPLGAFHDFCAAVASHRPHTLSATSTHDTKRSEDARARLNVLSEIPDRWTACVDRWRGWNAPLKRSEGVPVARDELLIYQSLVAIWPLEDDPDNDLVARLTATMIKSAREAKVETSWTAPDEAYESALAEFIAAILGGRRGSPFLADFLHLMRTVAPAGAINSLSQLTLKIASPGVPDFYQGTDLWDFALVDPDNRRPVGFARRAALLADLEQRNARERSALLDDLAENWRDGRIKLYMTWRGLHARRARQDLLASGAYLPLAASGPRAAHAVAFARRAGSDAAGWAIALATRLPVALLDEAAPTRIPTGRGWKGTTVPLPAGAPAEWVDAYTGERITAESGVLPLDRVLARFPAALLFPALT